MVDAAGADEKGRGQAAMLVTATLVRRAGGTKVEVAQDLQLSGAAAQYGRGMISDVTAVLMRDFATNMQNRITALDRGLSPDQVGRPRAGQRPRHRPARRVDGAAAACARRFFLPYQPNPS